MDIITIVIIIIIIIIMIIIIIIIIIITGKDTVYKQREPLFYGMNILDSSVTQVQAFSVAPFLGPLKLQKGPSLANF